MRLLWLALAALTHARELALSGTSSDAEDCGGLVARRDGAGAVDRLYAACRSKGIVVLRPVGDGHLETVSTHQKAGLRTVLLAMEGTMLYAVHEDARGAAHVEWLDASQDTLSTISTAAPHVDAVGCTDVAQFGQRLYLCCGAHLVVLDRVPKLRAAGSEALPEGTCLAVAADAVRSQVFVGTGVSLAIYDASASSGVGNPALAATVAAGAAGEAVYAMRVDGDLLYTAGAAGVAVFDASVPAALAPVASCCGRGATYYGMAKSSGVVYAVGTGKQGGALMVAARAVPGGIDSTPEAVVVTAGTGNHGVVVDAGGWVYASLDGDRTAAFQWVATPSASTSTLSGSTTTSSEEPLAQDETAHWVAFAGAVASTVGVGGGALPAMRFVLTAQTCTALKAAAGGGPLSSVLHIGGWSVSGSPALGLLLLNTIVAVAVPVLWLGMQKAAARGEGGYPKGFAALAACGHLLFPSPFLSVFYMAATGVAYAAWVLLLNPVSGAVTVAAMSGVLLVITVPLFTFYRLKDGVNFAVYLEDTTTPPCCVPVLGSGEYASLDSDEPWVGMYAAALLPHNEASVWWSCLECVLCLLFGFLSAFNPAVHCGWTKIAEGVICGALGAVLLRRDVYTKRRDVVVGVLANCVQFGMCAVMGYGFYAEDDAWDRRTRSGLLLAALLYLLKGVLDVMGLVVAVWTGRRGRLQREADSYVDEYMKEEATNAPPPEAQPDKQPVKMDFLTAPFGQKRTGAASRSQAGSFVLYLPPIVPVLREGCREFAKRRKAAVMKQAADRQREVEVLGNRGGYGSASAIDLTLSARAASFTLDPDGPEPRGTLRKKLIAHLQWAQNRQREDRHASPLRPTRRAAPAIPSPKRKLKSVAPPTAPESPLQPLRTFSGSDCFAKPAKHQPVGEVMPVSPLQPPRRRSRQGSDERPSSPEASNGSRDGRSPKSPHMNASTSALWDLNSSFEREAGSPRAASEDLGRNRTPPPPERRVQKRPSARGVWGSGVFDVPPPRRAGSLERVAPQRSASSRADLVKGWRSLLAVGSARIEPVTAASPSRAAAQRRLKRRADASTPARSRDLSPAVEDFPVLYVSKER
eukprot:TRINITY_DN19711_c0_g1_i1.p1 TRINITY_DN19711_c0_g1~~TRINITY_DN19711_c0_g1_i1.p1  ORF type:complete len:1090 (+),score=295.95 TRINITY_DN19711_c0_g1_i1:81-3350(+)